MYASQAYDVLECTCPGGSASDACDGNSVLASTRLRPSNADLLSAVEAIKRSTMTLFDEEVVRIASTLVSFLQSQFCSMLQRRPL